MRMRQMVFTDFRTVLTAVACALLGANLGICDDSFAVPLPDGVRAVWDVEKAARETTPTRERISINGLWRWQPARGKLEQIPDGHWGYFKVPGCWPGITDYLQKDCQSVFVHPAWKEERLAATVAAWYQREITIPGDWAGRRIVLSADYLNSRAVAYLDGQPVGDIKFPGGELDVTQACHPGATHVLSLFVEALPLKGVLLSYTDTNTAREVKGQVPRRGLCGDVFLESTPAGPRIGDVRVDTSVRRGEMTCDAALEGLERDQPYALRAQIRSEGAVLREFTSRAFQAGDVAAGRMAFSAAWCPDRLWDLHTPQNVYTLAVSLVDGAGKVLDSSRNVRFGFREFWIDGRDFYLNGTRIHLSAVPLDNAQVGAAWATYAGARESLERLKSFGINFVYTHNYGCEPGSHLSFTEVLRAAADVGMLVAFSQPHFAHYDWRDPEGDSTGNYARHAEFYVRQAQNHPSVVAYATSHNATGYEEDMNPDLIDGVRDPRGPGGAKSVERPLRAEKIIRGIDPGRIVYHHSSGNLGAMHTSNFYPNFAPIQELSDWFEHWATEGTKPVFTCEYGAPFSWDWSMYRGWYKGERSFGSARVPWDFCLSEWNSQFVGDAAFRTSAAEQANLRWEARQFRDGKLWNRWDYPHSLNSKLFDERYPIFARYLNYNWRAFRTWGVSAISPWEHDQFWKLRENVDKGRRELSVDWENLQRPGFSPDYLAQRYERMDLAFERADWVPTPAARALLRNNLPRLGWIAGKPTAFTSQDHQFYPGQTVEKQAVVINDSREVTRCAVDWALDLPVSRSGKQQVTVPTGDQARIPLTFQLPETTAPGEYHLAATFKFESGDIQEDAFTIHVRPRPPAPQLQASVAVFDPRGETREWLDRSGIRYQSVDAGADLAHYDMLVVGKSALTLDGPAPDITRVRDGLRVVLFEQTAEVLEQRFGFRVAEYGLRQVFPRTADHPLTALTTSEDWRDWCGAATLQPPRLKYELRPRLGPTVTWCDIRVPHLWRCGNRGNVASVLIEKPARGDFLPILDGGFSLQYAPLLEYREGRGLVMFCQMDVTGRTEADPTAEALAANLLKYAANWQAGSRRSAVYAGDPPGKAHLESAGLDVTTYDRGKLSANAVLVVGPGGGESMAGDAAELADWLKSGGNLLAVGLDEASLNALRLHVGTRRQEHISAFFDPFGVKSLLAGVGPADVHNRDPRELSLITSGATIFGDGVLARGEEVNAVFCQLAPWNFSGSQQQNLRKTFRRTSALLSRLLANLGVAGSTPILERFSTPIAKEAAPQNRWRDGLYLDQPEEWDDPYRFFRW
jgi:hypothetical protein